MPPAPSAPSLLRRLSVRRKLAVLGAVVLAAFAGSHAVQVSLLERFRVGGPTHAELSLQEETHDTLQSLLGELNAARAVLHLMLAPHTQDGARLLVRQWQEVARGVDARFARAAAARGAPPDVAAAVQDAQAVWDRYAGAVRTEVLGVPAERQAAAVAAFLQGAPTRRHARMEERLEAATHALRLQGAVLQAEVEGTVARTLLALAAAAALLGVLLAGVLLTVGRSITGPLRALVEAARQVEAGDLSVQLATAAPDEVGKLSRSLGRTVDQLRELLRAVRQAGEETARAVEALAAAADGQAQSVTRQAAAVGQTRAVAQELRQASDAAADRVADALRSAERADAVGRAGMEALGDSLRGIQDIHAQMDAISSRVAELSQRSGRVASITQAMGDLAKQSNALALNAAIEATRAGERAQGFKVVATSIRSLADRSLRAADEVREQVALTGSAVEGTVAITGEGRARVEQGLTQVRAGGERLEELARMLQESGEGLRRISGVVEQQHAGVGHIFSALTELSRTTDEAVSSVGSMRQSADALRSMSQGLTDSLTRFRL
jgi:methyl-accepting chemotaxis protein